MTPAKPPLAQEISLNRQVDAEIGLSQNAGEVVVFNHEGQYY